MARRIRVVQVRIEVDVVFARDRGRVFRAAQSLPALAIDTRLLGGADDQRILRGNDRLLQPDVQEQRLRRSSRRQGTRTGSPTGLIHGISSVSVHYSKAIDGYRPRGHRAVSRPVPRWHAAAHLQYHRAPTVSLETNCQGATMADLFDNPMGTDGFEFVEYTAPDPELLRDAVRAHGLPGGGAPPQQERHAAPAGRRQLHHQRRAGRLRPALRAAARPVGLRDGASASRTPPRPSSARWRLGATPVQTPGRPDGTQHPGDRGHRRQLIYLVDRYGERTIYDVDFVPVAQPAPSRGGRASP